MPSATTRLIALVCFFLGTACPAWSQTPTTRVELRKPAQFGDLTLEQLAPGLALVPKAVEEGVYVSSPVVPVFSRPLHEAALRTLGEPVRRRDDATVVEDYWGDFIRARDAEIIGEGKRPADPLLEARSAFGGGATPDPEVSFEGLSSAESGGFAPPDPIIAVGPSHVVEMTNVSFAIYDKSGTRVLAPTRLSTLWDTGECAGGDDGDPIALYDQVADRWLLSQFRASAPYGMCIAISQTADPLGEYFLYEFDMTFFPDYPKFGLWDDSYTMSAVEFDPAGGFSFAGIGAYAFDRAKMLAGDPSTYVRVLRTDLAPLLPADVDGTFLPDAGSPELFFTFQDDGFFGGARDEVQLYELDVDWSDPGTASFSSLADVDVAPFNYNVCSSRNCIPQPNTANGLDDLADRPMNRLAYRRFGTHEALVGLWTVDATGGRVAGQRWVELRNPGSGWALYQEGTQAPDTDNRWMGSAAMDAEGNLAIAYSISSDDTFPGIRYAARYAADPLGTLRDEATLVDGAGSAGSGNRYGDYSSLVLDPTDDVTFWFVAEYFDGSGNSQFDWETRIGSFRLGPPPALAASGSMQPEPVPAGEPVTVLATAAAGPGDLSGVAITATVPDGTAYVDGSATCGGSESGGVVTFEVGSVAAGASQTCGFQAQTSASTTSTIIATFADDHEDGPDAWNATHTSGAQDWAIVTDAPYSGTQHWFAADVNSVTDQRLALTMPQTVQEGDELAFWHRYNLENTYDGGVVEISTDGGATWVDLGGAMVQNGYVGALSTAYSNPLGGRNAFTGDSFQYVLTRVNLSAFAGEDVVIRFRLGTDVSVGDVGWSVDDVWFLRGGRVTGTGTVQSDIVITAAGQEPRQATVSGQVAASQLFVGKPVSGNGAVSFDGPGGDTGVDIVFDGFSGSATIGVTRIDRPAPDPDGILEPERPGASWLIEPTATTAFGFGPATEVRIALGTVPALVVSDPYAITGYKRPGDGSGPFEPLATSYDAGTNELVLSGFTSFSEFTFAGEAGALPVELASFDYRLAGRSVLLSWTTASETSNAGFDVEIASVPPGAAPESAAAFRSLGFVDGAGTTSDARHYTFETGALTAGDYRVRLRQVDLDGTATYSPVLEISLAAPAALALEAPVPNPSREAAQLGFTVPRSGPAAVAVYDVLGREVARLFEGRAEAGSRYVATFDAGAQAPGIYVVRLTHGGTSRTQRITVTR